MADPGFTNVLDFFYIKTKETDPRGDIHRFLQIFISTFANEWIALIQWSSCLCWPFFFTRNVLLM